MDRWAWEQPAPWLALRSALPVGALFCILRGPTGSAVGPSGRLHPTASRCLSRQGTPAVRAAPATPRVCRGDVARSGPTAGHPASTRTRRPRDHVGLPTRHRQHRDCPRRARATSSDDSGAERPQPIGLRRPWWVARRATHHLPPSRQRALAMDDACVAKPITEVRAFTDESIARTAADPMAERPPAMRSVIRRRRLESQRPPRFLGPSQSNRTASGGEGKRLISRAFALKL